MSKTLNFNVKISGDNKLKTKFLLKIEHFLSDNENYKKPVGRSKGSLVGRMEILTRKIKCFTGKDFNAYHMIMPYGHEKGCTNFPKL